MSVELVTAILLIAVPVAFNLAWSVWLIALGVFLLV